MTLETAQTLLRQIFSMASHGEDITISFQGGEPTLAGIGFYQDFTRMAEELCPPGCHLFWGIQTHGLNLDRKWVDLFVKYDFEVSVALDGYQTLHDENRINGEGTGTWKQACKLIRKLRSRDVVVNAQCVVTRQSSRRPEMIYRALRKLGVGNIVFLPYTSQAPEHETWALTSPTLANFLCRVFDMWFEDWEQGNACYINFFDDYLRLMQGKECVSCFIRGRCGSQILVDADGTLYPCAAYAQEPWVLGSVQEEGIVAALRSKKYTRFLQSGNEKPTECLSCSRQILCNGGCKHDWITDSTGVHNPYCDAYKRFFLYAYPRLLKVLETQKSRGKESSL